MHNKSTYPVNEKFDLCINYFIEPGSYMFFNRMEFFIMHSISEHDIYAQLVRKSDGTVCGTVTLYEITIGRFSSPKNGTFGGFEVSKFIDFKTQEQFVLSVFEVLKKSGARYVNFKLAPTSHAPEHISAFLNILIRNGGCIVAVELNYDQKVDSRPFLSRIDYGNQKRIRKALRNGYSSHKEQTENLSLVYKVIEENRKRKGIPMSMSFENLQKTVTKFQEHFHFFSVKAPDATMVASAVCIAITPAILYVFYWGEVDGLSNYSPVALLASSIYDYCQQQGYELLDAGISTALSKPNYGLIRFKENLGFRSSTKLIVELKLDDDIPIKPAITLPGD